MKLREPIYAYFDFEKEVFLGFIFLDFGLVCWKEQIYSHT